LDVKGYSFPLKRKKNSLQISLVDEQQSFVEKIYSYGGKARRY
jgi:hypothetical protein